MLNNIVIRFIFVFLSFFLFSSFSFSNKDKEDNSNLKIVKIINKKNVIEVIFTKEKQESQNKQKIIQNNTNETNDKVNINKIINVNDQKNTSNENKIDIQKEIKNIFFSKNVINKDKIVKLENTEIHILKSNFNQTKYKISISFPTDYEISDKKYPVVYVLDGHYSFTISHGLVRYLQDKGLEKFILVGIGYDDSDLTFNNEQERIEFYKKNRTRDYTPIKSTTGINIVKYQDVSGQGENFAQFINNQLIPFIDKNYKTIKNDNTLIGHSYGGLFTIWNYIIGNENFKNFIAISPSCWYENSWILKLIKSKTKLSNSRIYFSVGGKETQNMIFNIKETLKEFRKKEQSRYKIKFETIKDENHETLFSSSFIHGVNFIFNKN